jgi:hypothetical protein
VVSNLRQNYTSAVILHGQQQVKPCPSDIVVFQSGNNQAEVSNVLQILLLVPFVTNSDRNFWNFYVNEEFVLLSTLLLGTNTECSITITKYQNSLTFIRNFSNKLFCNTITYYSTDMFYILCVLWI